MPTYEYLCKTCSHRFETWQKMTDEPLTVCPECGGHIRRVLFPAVVVFKGSGFYKTDHGNGTHANANAKNGDNHKAESNGATSESGGKSESKSSESTASSSSTPTSESKPSTTSASKVA